VVVGGIIPSEDARLLTEAGVRRIYTPKDYNMTQIMADIVETVAESHAGA
jgi:(2R)-ethylmalonyl-CoA mutase